MKKIRQAILYHTEAFLAHNNSLFQPRSIWDNFEAETFIFSFRSVFMNNINKYKAKQIQSFIFNEWTIARQCLFHSSIKFMIHREYVCECIYVNYWALMLKINSRYNNKSYMQSDFKLHH